jgi:SAM-dependent methyltransferase
MNSTLPPQQTAHEEHYGGDDISRFAFHTSNDPFTRYLRDRRLQKGLEVLKKQFGKELFSMKVLSVCGGAGGEGIFFRRAGFEDVTVSDFSENALSIARKLDVNLKTIQLDAEAMKIPDGSYDIVIVHDGLHHLPRPVTGFNEMLRVAKMAAIVIEPYEGLVGRAIGTEWESTEGAMNFVFRWDRRLIEQTVKSFLLKNFSGIKVIRLWDHSLVISKLTRLVPGSMRCSFARFIYAVLGTINFAGNNMIAIVFKNA